MIDKEGYRENVAIVIINSDHKVLWAKEQMKMHGNFLKEELRKVRQLKEQCFEN